MGHLLTNPENSIWLTEKFFKGTSVNNICGYVYIKDEVNFDVLKKSINELVKTNDSMRFKFKEENGTCIQYENNYEDFDIETFDFSSENDIEKKALEMANVPFDFENSFLFKFILFKLPNNSGGFIVNVHHIIGDSWTLGLIAKEVTGIYSSILNNTYEEKQFPSYINYINNENEYINSEKYIKDKAYWDEVFTTVPEVASIPSMKDNKNITHSCKGAREKFIITEKEISKIKEFCTNSKISVYNFFMAIYSLYLGRVSNLDDFVIGTPILNRTNFEQKHTMGMFISTAPLRINLDHKLSFIDFSKNIASDSMSLLRHQRYPYQAILEDIRKKDSNIPNLYNVVLSYQITKTVEEENNIKYSTDWVFNGNCADDLQIHLFDLHGEDKFTVAYDYKAEKYDSKDIKDLHSRILTVINQVIDNNEILLKNIEIVTPEEKHKILYEFNNTAVDYPRDKTIVDLFEEQVEKTPDNIAVVFEDQKLTYRELNQKANQLARYLIQNGVESKDVVGLRIDKSLEMIISIIAIIKAGCCYLPFNMAYPEDRVNYMLEDSNCKILLTSKKSNNISLNINCLDVDLDNDCIYQGNTNNVNIKISPEDLIYIIYTSGSTGKPKGAMLCHRNVVRLMKNDKYLFDFSENDIWTMFHSVAFDFSVWEMYGALLYGGKLILITDDVARDPKLFLALLRKEQVTILNQTPTYFYNLQNQEININNNDLKVRYIIFGGEALNPTLLQPWNQKYPNTALINMYGITETTVHVTFKKLAPEDLLIPSSNIGTPIPTLHVLILDKNKNLLPFGTEGEMYVLGDGVFKGYLNREDLNKEKLLYLNQYSNMPVYKSADSAIMYTNGDLEYKGRIDTQVKIRGFRIELGEIEHKISELSNIEKCIVCKKTDISGRDLLCAYYIKNGPVNIQVLRKLLSKDLPNYMIPQYFIEIDYIPININGKIDLKALPLPNVISEEEVLDPKTDTEKTIYQTYKSILGIDNFSMNDSFYDLGGDSLSAITISSKLSSTLNVEITVKDILNIPILKNLSEYVSTLSEAKNIYTITKDEKQEYYPLSSAQKRIYYASGVDHNSTIYNIAGGVVLNKNLDINKLQKCFNVLIKRHSVLRACFEIKGNDIVQIIKDKIDFKLELDDSNNIKDAYSTFVKPFNLSIAPLFRAKITKLEDKKMLILIDMHHIISDGTSLSILLQELCALYNDNELPEKQIDYTDFTLWEKKQLENDKFKITKEYWLNQFKDEIPLLNMPTTNPRPSVQSFEGSNYHTLLSKDIFDKINKVAKDLNITPYMLMLSCYYILLSKYTSQDDIVVGTPIVGRELPELSNMLGMFVNTLALRNKIDSSLSFKEFSRVIKENCLNSFKNQSYPFDMLVKDLNINRDISRNPLFDVMFVYQNNGYPEINFKDTKAEYFIPDNNVSKFDLSLEVMPVDNECSLRFEYCTKLFDKEFIQKLSSHYINILNTILDNNEIKIVDIDMLSEEERNQILYEFNNTNLNYPKDKTIINLFEEQVEKTPDNIAVVFEDQKLTYKELNEKANQLARYLQANSKISKNEFVGIMLPRSLNTIISMFSILKLGCPYLLIDPTLPTDRISYMLNNCNSKLLITNTIVENLKMDKQLSINEDIFEYSKENINKNVKSTDPLCVIYTSGSTGVPKGVVLTHLGVNNMFQNYLDILNVDMCSNFLSISTVSFDMFIVETMVPLLSGKTLILSNDEEQKVPINIQKLITDKKVEFILTTPSRIDMLLSVCTPSSFNSVKIIQLGGEALTLELVKKLRACTTATIYNGYGPSEITACCTSKKITEDIVNIGKPFNNFKIYVLNNDLNICPVGVPGEICISGDGVSLGYMNNKEQTQKVFVPNPFGGGTLYRSGDLGKYNSNGEIDYIGRIDNQIKIRGLRIEISEIENKLLEIPGITNCAVIYNKQQQYLSAFITAKENIGFSKIKKHLLKCLPLYMLPKYITKVDALPITSNGKIDKNILITYKENHLESDDVVEPSSQLEKLCCNVWNELLETTIGVTDNIFEFGADSLLAIKFKTQMLSNNINIPYADIFKYPSIRELCDNIDNKQIDDIDNYDYSQINTLLEKNNIKNINNIVNTTANNVLLLGSNGFVGMHILSNLIESDTGNIYCIVRDKNKTTAHERFLDTLHFYFGNKLDKYINNRIFVIKGNILKDNFELSDKTLNELIHDVEIVVNAASLVKHYGNKKTFYDINVGSTQTAIEFCKNFNKRLIHISSLSVSGNDTLEGNTDNKNIDIKENFSENNLYIGQKISNIYVQSKFDSEKLILDNIINHQLKAQILRLGNITNRFSDGKFQINPDENAFVNKLKSIIHLGIIPDNLLDLYLEFTPVDICGKVITLIIQNYVEYFSVFHIYNHNHVYINKFIEMLDNINISINTVSKNEFKSIIDKKLIENPNILSGIINDFDSDKNISYDSNINILSEFTRAFLYNIGFKWPEINIDYIKKYIKYLNDINLI